MTGGLKDNQLNIFSDIPLELRLNIWLFTIPDDDEGVCLCWPSGLSTASQYDEQAQCLEDLPVLPLIVDVAFQLSMHICCESRAVAQDKKHSGVHCRASHVARCMTPFRHARPEPDVLYLSHDSIHHIMLLVDRHYSFMESLGLDAAQEDCYDVFMDILRRTRRLTTPESLGFVFSSSMAYTWRVGDMPGPFVPPGKRCRLITFPSIADDVAMLVRTREYRRRISTAKEPLAEAHWQMEECCDDMSEGRTMAGMEDAGLCRAPKSSSWSEVCKDIMYVGSRHPVLREFVPVNQRPKRELVSVHDTDVIFPSGFV